MQQFQIFYWVSSYREINQLKNALRLIYWFAWLGILICICWSHTFKRKGRGVDQKTSQYLVWSPFTSWRATSPLHRVDQAVEMLSHSLFNSCAKLLDIGKNWNTLSYVDPELPKPAQWVTCLVSMQAMEELGHFQLPGIVNILATWGCALPFWNMRWWWRMNGNGPQDLVTVSLCIQIAIDKNAIVFVVHNLCLPIP